MYVGRRRGWMGVFVIGGIFAAAACGGSSNDNNNGNGNDGGGTNNDGGGPGNDGGEDDSGNPPPDDGGTDSGTPPNPKMGHVTVTNNKSQVNNVAVGSYGATAGFVDATGVTTAPSACQNTTEGPCSISVCPIATPSDAGTADAGTPTEVSAGNIEISSTAFSPAIVLRPNANNTYTPVNGPNSLWSGGETIQFKAAGATGGVGAFTDTVKAPSVVTVSNPTWAAPATGPTIPRNKPLDIAWPGPATETGMARVTLIGHDANDTVSVHCAWKATANKGTVPATALAKIPAGNGTFAVQVTEQKKTTDGDWTVNLSLNATAARPNGGFASSTNATFQ